MNTKIDDISKKIGVAYGRYMLKNNLKTIRIYKKPSNHNGYANRCAFYLCKTLLGYTPFDYSFAELNKMLATLTELDGYKLEYYYY